jgi:hypothetical protein
MQFPTTLTGLIIWVIALIVIVLVAVFLFNGIIQPLIKDITH